MRGMTWGVGDMMWVVVNSVWPCRMCSQFGNEIQWRMTGQVLFVHTLSTTKMICFPSDDLTTTRRWKVDELYCCCWWCVGRIHLWNCNEPPLYYNNTDIVDEKSGKKISRYFSQVKMLETLQLNILKIMFCHEFDLFAIGRCIIKGSVWNSNGFSSYLHSVRTRREEKKIENGHDESSCQFKKFSYFDTVSRMRRSQFWQALRYILAGCHYAI